MPTNSQRHRPLLRERDASRAAASSTGQVGVIMFAERLLRRRHGLGQTEIPPGPYAVWPTTWPTPPRCSTASGPDSVSRPSAPASAASGGAGVRGHVSERVERLVLATSPAGSARRLTRSKTSRPTRRRRSADRCSIAEHADDAAPIVALIAGASPRSGQAAAAARSPSSMPQPLRRAVSCSAGSPAPRSAPSGCYDRIAHRRGRRSSPSGRRNSELRLSQGGHIFSPAGSGCVPDAMGIVCANTPHHPVRAPRDRSTPRAWDPIVLRSPVTRAWRWTSPWFV